MKIVLIRPPEINRIWVGIPQFFNEGIFIFPPLGILQLKTYLEKHTPYTAVVYDSLIYKGGYSKLESFIKKNSPQVVGISTFTHSLIDVIETAKTIKAINSKIHITAGGPHTYTFPEESKYMVESCYIDSVVLGDGEETLRRIVESVDGKRDFETIDSVIYRDRRGQIIKKGDPCFLEDLDFLPFPARNTFRFRKYYTPASSGKLMTTMISSRGCPYSCKFCNVQKKYRARSVKNVVDEMEVCRNLGFREVFFIDDTFNVTAERVIRISEEILKRRLKIKWGFKGRCDNVTKDMLTIAKKAGCFRIHYGVETGRKEGLAAVNKRETLEVIRKTFFETRKSSIRTSAYFIIGCPDEKKYSDVLETINFARSLPADFAVFSLLSPYPDTPFYQQGVKEGIFNPADWQNFMQKPSLKHNLPLLWTEHFSHKELLEFLRIAHRKFYYRFRIILNAVFSTHSLTELKRILMGAVSLLKLELFHRFNRTG